jgi:hypothetical protein
MMEDNKIAKIFISAIIEEEVVELDFADARISWTKPKKNRAIFYRMSNLEFIAKIHTTGGYKTVIIEIQRSSLHTDIIRFRQDTEFRYRNHENHEIYCIYFLGDGLKVEDVPVIVVNNNVAYTQATGECLDVQHEFFSIIHHKSWIIQIPCITRGQRRNDLEKLLGIIFDQNKTFDGQLFVDIGDEDEAEDFPEKFRPIIRHLVAATQDRQIVGNQKFEYYYLADIRAVEAQKDYIIAELDKKIAEKDKKIAEHAENAE